MSKQPLKIIPLGGTTTVQKNMYVYEYENDILIMDCGIGFPDAETPGIDVIIPDFTYILNNREKVKGIVITHGHEDHRSSLPYLLREHKFNVYAAPFVKGLIEKSLEEYTDLDKIQIKAFDPNRTLQIGIFKLHPFRVNHSIPDTLGFAIDTPQGRIFHNADFKFDWSPVMDKPFNVQKAALLASEPKYGVLALLSDCLGATTSGYSQSESKIQDEFENILRQSKGQQVLITTVSSNISRVKQAIEASIKHGRKVVISGRSLRNTISVAKSFGYINFPDNIFVDERSAHSHPQEKLTHIITGCYGQKNSGLTRAAIDEHRHVKLENNAVVVFSADPIPNTISAVNLLIDELYAHGAQIYYHEIQDNLHVSGHGSRGDLTLLANIVRPKYFIPIGGNIKHMRAYSKLMQSQGIKEDRIFQLLDGQAIIFQDGKARLGERLKLKEVYVDGSLVGDVGTSVIRDRLQMSNHGMVVVVINKGGKDIEIVTRGFVFVKGSKKLLEDAKTVVKKKIQAKGEQKGLKREIEHSLQSFFYEQTGREPIILVTVL